MAQANLNSYQHKDYLTVKRHKGSLFGVLELQFRDHRKSRRN